ncbi:MAG: hypothetical protein ABGX87_11700 [Alcanivorax sp.]|uniref:hypothetical protein n=1 Tax=Alloalcanivorax marinus TaxID=1177169 RepID=UPI00195CCD68|nr:hypothetical protein [Alloalcanivorax marinus]MBM7334684.1 hypothetical protein [Alloalcanivorax marinus]
MKLKKHHAMAALLAASALLSACEDDNYRPDPEPEASAGALVFTENNAARVTGDILVLNGFLVFGPETFFSPVNYLMDGSDCLSGQGSVVKDEQGRPVRLTANDCVVEENGPNNRIIVDGALSIEYSSDDRESPPSLIEADDYRVSIVDENPQSELNGRIVFHFDGAMPVNFESGLESPNFENVNGTLGYLVDIDENSELQGGDFNWVLKDYTQRLSDQGTGPVMELSGQVGLTGGSITLTTHAPITPFFFQLCPTQGDLTLQGGEGTSLNLTVVEPDDILITLNGVGTHYTCEEFEQWVTEAIGPIFAPF